MCHTYRHPNDRRLGDLKTMTRDDLYGYYAASTCPNSTLVIVGDIAADDAIRRASATLRQDSARRRRTPLSRPRSRPARRAPGDGVERGTTGYLKLVITSRAVRIRRSFRARARSVLTGAKGLNLWPLSHAAAATKRRLTRAGRHWPRLGGHRRPGAKHHPSCTRSRSPPPKAPRSSGSRRRAPDFDGVRERDHARRTGQGQEPVRARMVFEATASPTLPHQLGSSRRRQWRTFATLGERIASVTLEQVADAAGSCSHRTVPSAKSSLSTLQARSGCARMSLLASRSLGEGLAPTRGSLQRGRCHCQEHRDDAGVTLNASIHAGIAYDPPGLRGLAHFASRVIDRGTASRSATTLRRARCRGVSLAVTVNGTCCLLRARAWSRIRQIWTPGRDCDGATFPSAQVETVEAPS